MRPFETIRSGWHVERARLGGEHDEVVVGDDVARRPEPVAVERPADHAAVGERDERGTVPRLHHRRVVLAEPAAIEVHVRVPLPRLGDEHRDRVGERATTAHEELERVVEAHRVRLPVGDDRIELVQVVAEQPRLHRRLAHAHPVQVAAQRVDLAVVAEEAVRVRARPGGQRVGGEARVHERDGAREVGRAEVGIEVGELLGHEHSLVHDRARREADDIEAARVPIAFSAWRRMTYSLRSNDFLSVLRPRAMNTCRKTGAAARATGQPGRGSRARRASPRMCCPFLLDDVLQDELARAALPRVGGEEDHADRITARTRELDAELRISRRKNSCWQLDDEAGAVAAARIAAHGAAVGEVLEERETLAYDLVRGRAANVRDEPHAARVALVPLRIVQPFLLRQSVVHVSGAPRCGRPTKKPLLTAGQEGPLHHSVPASS
jgi:hypothetical protein